MKPALLKPYWTRLAPREQALVAGAATLVALALLWWVLLAPPLKVLGGAAAQHRVLDEQLQRMTALQSQAEALKSQPHQSQDEAVRLLEATVRQQLGLTARMAVAGERVTITLAGAPPQVLTRWLAQARTNAHVLPAEARLMRNPAGLWDGTLVLALPPR